MNQNKTVFITGISHGIGKATAMKFLNENYNVIGTSIDGQLDYNHKNLKIIKLDLYNQESIDNCVKELSNMNTKIDIYINNAGILLDEGEDYIVIDKLKNTLQVNLIGPIDLTQKNLHLINDNGHIINISSSAASLEKVHHTDYPAYKISKTALNMFTVWLAFKLKDRIKVSCLHPGRVKTAMGAWEGDMETDEVAEYIYKTAIDKDIETGQFWYKGEKFPW